MALTAFEAVRSLTYNSHHFQEWAHWIYYLVHCSFDLQLVVEEAAEVQSLDLGNFDNLVVVADILVDF